MALGEYGDGCSQLFSIELEDGNVNNFVISWDTYILFYTNLYVGMHAMFFYDRDLPVPLIYPPQFHSVAVAEMSEEYDVALSYFNQNLIAYNRSLQLIMNPTVPVITINNQTFLRNPANRYLLVVYDRTTRSLPAQTTPLLTVVMCNL